MHYKGNKMKYSNFKTLDNLIDYHSTSEPTMYLCDLTGLSVNDRDFDSLQAWFDHNDPFYYSALKMRSGGSFASHISDAYMVADTQNRLKLIEAFNDLFRRFMSMSITEEA
jgi:hypothetical protein